MDVQGTVTSIELLRFQWSEAHKNKPKVKVTALCTSHQEGEKKKAGKLGGFFAFRKQSIHSGISLTRQSLRLSSSGRGPEQERALQWVQAVVHAARLGPSDSAEPALGCARRQGRCADPGVLQQDDTALPSAVAGETRGLFCQQLFSMCKAITALLLDSAVETEHMTMGLPNISGSFC